MDHPYHPTLQRLLETFPTHGKYRNGPWVGQTEIFKFVAEHGSALIESPTGTGKSPVEVAALDACGGKVEGARFLVVPTKALVQQLKTEFPHLSEAVGRGDHPCLYYEEDKSKLNPDNLLQILQDPNGIRADQVPCSMLKDCPHRVNQETGETFEPGAYPCPYLQQKYEAKQSDQPIVTTMAFYLFAALFTKEFGDISALVIDEVHKLPDVIRNVLSYDISDWHLGQAKNLLKRLGAPEAKVIQRFLITLKRITKAKKRQAGEETLLTDEEILRLMAVLEQIDANELRRKIEQAVKERVIDPMADRVTLKQLETLVRDVRRYLHSFEYSLSTDERKALNYTCAFYKKEKGENDRVQYKLVIRCYYVAPLIRKILAPFTLALSATIGDPEVFGHETGIRYPFYTVGSSFPVNHTRIYMPTDTLNLAVNNRSERDLPRTLRMIARACKRFARQGHRSLVVTISNQEKDRFMLMAREENLEAVSYGNGVAAKDAAQVFREGFGETLVGTATHYGEGIDLPKQTAPVIFFLRPGYPNPDSAVTKFEERRFGNSRWALWNWRVMNQALQTRGRNIRSRSDVGVTFFISQQFRRFVYAALPEWLKPAYRGEMTWEKSLIDAELMLSEMGK